MNHTLNTNKHYIIIGKPRHGKTTTAEELARITGNRSGSTSNRVYEIYAQQVGKSVDEVKKLDKETIRPILSKIGNEFCKDNPTALVDSLLNQGIKIIDGVRRKKEFETVCAHFAKNNIEFIVIWVENPNKPDIVDNTEVQKEDADIIIWNSGDIPSLYSKINRLLN